MVAVHNLSAKPSNACLDLSAFAPDSVEEVFGDGPYPPLKRAPYKMRLNGNGYRWLRLHKEESTRVLPGKPASA